MIVLRYVNLSRQILESESTNYIYILYIIYIYILYVFQPAEYVLIASNNVVA